jgi:2-polyprenyl-6-methoxyphenol hydroxylase-like FAD-dependent oxidoreductase
MSSSEQVDAVVVGARCAGSAAAAMLARAGRSVVVLDRARFPRDTLSTHAMFPSGCAEFQRIGAWPRIVSELDPPRLTHMQITVDDGIEIRERWEPVDGIDHGVSIPRDQLDVLLVSNARDCGADVREGCTVEGVLWRHGRVAGVEYTDREGTARRIDADLVVGADGRRSTVAATVGAWTPYRVSKNGRGLVFRYMDDPAHEPWHRETLWQWRDGESLAFAFPNPSGRVLVLFMGDAREVADARSDPDGYWQAKLAVHPGCAARIEGARNETKLRSTGDVVAFWRASSGPGWVLAGDASHFKDPVTGQGMGDALRMGRTLGEQLAPALGDPAETDRRARRWERDTTAHCLHAYHFANLDTIVRTPPRVLKEAIREFSRNSDPSFSHVIGRTRTAQQVFSAPVLARAAARALAGGPGRGAVLRDTVGDLGTELRIRRELARGGFRPAGPVRGSDHPGAAWSAPPSRERRPV